MLVAAVTNAVFGRKTASLPGGSFETAESSEISAEPVS